MTLKFMDGFESYGDVADLSKVYPVASDASSYFSFPTGRRAGTKCLNWTSAGGSTGSLRTPINTETFIDYEYCIAGFAFKVERYDNIYMHDFYAYGSEQSGVKIDFLEGEYSINVLRYTVSTYLVGTFSYEPDTWNYLEVKVKISNSTGTIIVRLNEQEMVNYVGDTYQTGNVRISRVGFSFRDDWTISIDDFYIAGSEGSYNNDFLGDVRIDAIRPNGAGNYAQLTPSAGNNYECVDEIIADEADYVEGANSAEKDSYAFPDVPTDLDDTDIKGISLRNISQRTASADNIKMKGLLRTGSTDYNASEISLAEDWSSKDFIFERDPSDSLIWTQVKINACEFGMEVA